jgi:hypothetical protein
VYDRGAESSEPKTLEKLKAPRKTPSPAAQNDKEALLGVLNILKRGVNPDVEEVREKEAETKENSTIESKAESLSPDEAGEKEKKYLIEEFRAVDMFLLVFGARRLGKNLVEWKEIKKSVESTTRRNFSLESFSKLLSIFPGAYIIGWSKSDTEGGAMSIAEGPTNGDPKMSSFGAQRAAWSWKRLSWMEDEIVVRVGDDTLEGSDKKEASSTTKMQSDSGVQARATIQQPPAKKASFKERQIYFKERLEARMEAEKAKLKSAAGSQLPSSSACSALIQPLEEPFKALFDSPRPVAELQTQGQHQGNNGSTLPLTGSALAPQTGSNTLATRSIHPIDALLLGKNHPLHKKTQAPPTLHSL